jgi:RHS repeat-associated protein
MRYVAPLTAAAVIGGVVSPAAPAAAAPAPPGPARAASPAADFGAGAAASDDVAVNAFGDGTGYHIQVGTERSGFTWHEIALLRPDGLDDSSWTGYQCTSGDGRYEAVAVLPISAVNNTSALEHGAFAYSVDLTTGAVRPIATGVSLRYHSPGCGTGDEAAFSVSLGDSEQTTQILTANLATGAVEHSTTVAGELTSAVPVNGGLVAALGSELVSVPMVTGTAAATKLAATGGPAYELRPSADGGVDFLTLKPGATTATLDHEHAGSVSALATGAASTLSLFQGRAGHNTVVGASALAKGSTVRSVGSGSLGSVGGASLNGDALLGSAQTSTTPDPSILATTTGHMITRAPATNSAPATTGYSSLVPAGVPAAGGVPSLAAPAATTPAAPAAQSMQTVSTTGTPVEAAVITPAAATPQTPACAVARNSPTFQVMQPGNAQIDWAVQMAEQNLLTGSQYTRPANYDNMGLAAYAPNSDFGAIALDHPSSDTWSTVPRSVYEAILAQESNWDQASWHALPGIAGNPLVADYYGAAGAINTINYSAADCGYGIGQVTTGMAASQTGQEYSLHGQEKIAVDYQENIAAGLQILENTWNQLYTAGITVNGGDPKYLEDWYYAIWAYNTGIEPNAAHGNTTGCTPGPTCTGPDGTWGLGWANNPANPAFPPNRLPYLKTTYADAAHPADWPYQERVLGWMGSPLIRSNSHAYATPTYNGGSTWLQIPSFSAFCTTAGDDCTPPTTGGQSGTCTLADSDCWWHLPVTTVANCSTTCATSSYSVGAGSTAPSVSDPHPPVCSLDTSVVPTTSNGPPIIVPAQVGLAAGATSLNIVGCGSSQNWSNGGSFTYSYGTNANGDPTGAIDTHQLGAGFGGYMMFTHTENGSDPTIMNTGTWTPTLPKLQYYKIKLHIPATGAAATDVVYTINPGGGAAPWKIRVNQAWGSDQWVTIGTFAMQNGGSVQLSNQSSMTPGGYDVGFDAVAFLPQGGTPGTPIGGPPGIMDAPKGSNPAFVNCGCVARTAGDPVDTATGYYGETDTDLSTPGRGMPLDFTRSYASALADPAGPNGADAVNGPFGYGWTFSYGLSATTNATTGNVTINQEDGSQVTFIDTSGSYAPSAPRFDATLTKSGSSYTYIRPGKQVYTFDTATGHLTAETDLTGANASPPYATTLAYNAGGQLSTITDPAGHVYTLGWTGTHITSLTDSAGREVSYGYDASGDLTDVYGVATVRTPTLQNNDHTTYTYNTTTHLITGVRQPKYYGVTTSPTPAMSMVYDSSERVTSQTDQTGHTTTFTYGPSTSPSLVAGQTLVTDPSGGQTLDTYQSGLLTSETKGYSTAAASTTSYTYDPVTLGVSTVTDPDGNVETFAYDDQGNKISESNGLGQTTAYTYDALGDMTAKIDPLGVETSYGYDQAGHIATSSGTNNGTLTYGLPTSVTTTQLQQSAEIVDANPGTMPTRTVNYYYDTAAHPGDRTRVVDANNNTTTTTYDSYGNVASTTDQVGDVTKYGYNTGTGWLTSKVSGNGVAAGTVPGCTPPAKGCTTYAYDPYGRLIQTTDSLGHTTKSTYDANGNVLTSTDGNNNTTTYAYDADNRQTSVTNPDTTVSRTDYNPNGTIADTIDAGNNKTTYTYDSQGRKLSQTDPDNRTTSYTYDATGNILTVTNPAKQVTTNGYNAANELTSIKYSDGSTPNETLAYNQDGLRTSMTDGTGTTTWSYDAFGETVSETNGAGSTTGYTYDNNGNVVAIAYPGGSSQTVTQVFDKANRLTSVTDWNSNKTTFGYDNDGDLTSTTYPDGVIVSSAYDNSDALSSTAAAKGTTTLASVAYTRDTDGQILTTTPTGLPGSAQTYAYTALEQLKSATAGTTTSYTYNAAGNTTSTGSAQGFDAASQLCWTLPTAATSTAACTAPPTGATTYTYNSQGDRTATTPATGTASTYTYNQANEMTGATASGTTATYTYNGQGLRATKTVGSVKTPFTWDIASTPDLLSDGTNSYVYGPGDLPIEQITSATTLWYFHDALGSTRALLSSTGTVAGAYSYDAYGNTTGHTGTATTPLGYTGAYTDSETGFLYLRARYYDPATTQFVSQDPAYTTTLQYYTYADDNPINRYDPTGQCFCLFGHNSNGACNGDGVMANISKDFVEDSAGGAITGGGAVAIGGLITGPFDIPAAITGGVVGWIAGAIWGVFQGIFDSLPSSIWSW